MFFKKKKSDSRIEKLTDSLKVFILLNTINAEESLSKGILVLPNFNLTFEYETLSIFTVDYCITSKIKDTRLKDLILESFYSKWNTYYSDEQFRILKLKLDRYAQTLKKYNDWPTIVQNFGYMFSTNVLKKVEPILASRLSDDYTHLKSEIERIINESKLNESE